MKIFQSLASIVSPFAGPFGGGIGNFGAKIGAVVGNNFRNAKPLGTNLIDVLSKPTAPVVINNPPKLPGQLGFGDKTLITAAVVMLGGVLIFRLVK